MNASPTTHGTYREISLLAAAEPREREALSWGYLPNLQFRPLTGGRAISPFNAPLGGGSLTGCHHRNPGTEFSALRPNAI